MSDFDLESSLLHAFNVAQLSELRLRDSLQLDDETAPCFLEAREKTRAAWRRYLEHLQAISPAPSPAP